MILVLPHTKDRSGLSTEGFDPRDPLHGLYDPTGHFLQECAALGRADPATGAKTGQLTDKSGKPVKASNNMLASETVATGERVLRTNQQGAPAWPAGLAIELGTSLFREGQITIAAIPFDLIPWRAPGIGRLLLD